MTFIQGRENCNCCRVAVILGFLFLCGSTAKATILVTNDWAEAVVQVRDGKAGGPVLVRQTSLGVGEVDISVSAQRDFAGAGLMHNRFPVAIDTFINAYVLTDDSRGEAEAWLRASWSFTVQDDPVDFLIDLRVEEGGDFTSTYQLYDQTTQSVILDESLYSYGGYRKSGTLLAGHDYIFNAYLPRFDADSHGDHVFDGPSILDFHGITTGIRYLQDRTHLPLSVPEPDTFALMGIGLSAVVILRFAGCSG